MLSNILHKIIDNCSIFNQQCQLCGLVSCAHGICPACLRLLTPLPPDSRCIRCALPLSAAGLCGACLQHPPAFDALHAPYVFCYPLDVLIHRFKYGRHIELASALGHLLCHGVTSDTSGIDVVIPVPLAKERLAERGFNQSAELARSLAGTIRSRFDPTLCGRKRNTAAQAGLDLAARRRNLRDAFCVDPAVAGLSIAIVDDVATTGETLSEMAATLKKGGPNRVLAWALSRAVAIKT